MKILPAILLEYPTRKFALLIVIIFIQNYCNAQYQSPYKIKNNYPGEELDSIWVLFPDIQSSTKKIIVPAQPLLSPENLKLCDTILLDSLYRMEIIVIHINWFDSSNCIVLCQMPERQNTLLKIKYRTFGKKWVFEGDTGYDPISCDHLTIGLWDEKHISFGFTLSRNCN